MPQVKLRLGEVTAEEMIPNLEALEQEAEDIGIKGGRGDRQYAEEIERTDDYLYLYFVQEVSEERPQFSENEETEEIEVRYDDTFVARSMRFLLRDDGYYAFQSRQGVYGRDAIEYLLSNQDITGLDFTLKESFPEEWRTSFYERTPTIRKVVLNDIGERESSEVEENLSDLVLGAGEPAGRAEFSTSGRDNNLRGSDLIDALVRLSDLQFVSGKDSEGELTKLNESGRLTFSHPADLNHGEVAERMYEATERILGNLDT